MKASSILEPAIMAEVQCNRDGRITNLGRISEFLLRPCQPVHSPFGSVLALWTLILGCLQPMPKGSQMFGAV
jgi:hypothetical protein